MPKFRKKPVEIEAWEWTGDASTRPDWLPRPTSAGPHDQILVVGKGVVVQQGERLFIGTLEGTHRANPGDWIIRCVKGEFYPCKPDIFAATYEPVDDPESFANIKQRARS